MTNWAQHGDVTFKPCGGCGHSSFVKEDNYCACADDPESSCHCTYRMAIERPVERFCAENGWYFSREKDGTVRVDVEVPGREYVAQFSQATWASLVAHVSARGIDAETFAQAARLHRRLERGA